MNFYVLTLSSDSEKTKSVNAQNLPKEWLDYTEKTGVSNFECQNVDSQSELLDSTTLSPKFFLFGQGETHLIFCLTVTRGSESL